MAWGWFWKHNDLGAGPYAHLDDVVAELGLEADRKNVTADQFITHMEKCGIKIEYRYGEPHGLLKKR